MANTPVERHLLTIREGHAEATYVLDAGAYSIGRDPNCAIVLGSKSISRRHALLLRTPNPKGGGYRYRIIDGDAQGRPSANGIQINNQPCKEKQLEDRDYIVFGGQEEVHAQYRVETGRSEISNSARIAQFRSIKQNNLDPSPTISGEDIIFQSGVITQIQSQGEDGTILVEIPSKGIVEVPLNMPQVLSTLRVGDRVNLTVMDDNYMFLGKLDGLVEDRTLSQNTPGNLSGQANPTHPHKPRVLDPLLTPTLQGKSASLPEELKESIEAKVKLFRRCYEAAIREMGDLELQEEQYVAIAGQIFSSLDSSYPHPKL